MINDVISLIKDYTSQVELALNLFMDKTQEKDIMRAWREKRIPQTGIINDDLSYELHGVGCTFIFSDYELDFDFDYNNTIDGFDYWKLKNFAFQFPNKYPIYQDASALKRDYDLLIEQEYLYKLNKNSTLFHLRP